MVAIATERPPAAQLGPANAHWLGIGPSPATVWLGCIANHRSLHADRVDRAARHTGGSAPLHRPTSGPRVAVRRRGRAAHRQSAARRHLRCGRRGAGRSRYPDRMRRPAPVRPASLPQKPSLVRPRAGSLPSSRPLHYNADAQSPDAIRLGCQSHTGGTVDLGQPAPSGARRGPLKQRRRSNANVTADGVSPVGRRPRRAKRSAHQKVVGRTNGNGAEAARPTSSRATSPTSKMVAFAERLARDKRANLPTGYDKDFDVCRRFLDQHLGRA